jgi:hypothetical protein
MMMISKAQADIDRSINQVKSPIDNSQLSILIISELIITIIIWSRRES